MRKVTKNYPRRRPNKKNNQAIATLKKYVWAAFGLLFLGSVIYHYRTAFAYYLGFKSDKLSKTDVFSEARNLRVLEKHEGKAVGIDVSEYQGKISWSYVDTIENQYPLHFVFIRATAGNDAVDRRF